MNETNRMLNNWDFTLVDSNLLNNSTLKNKIFDFDLRKHSFYLHTLTSVGRCFQN
jgi:hypothetical protein